MIREGGNAQRNGNLEGFFLPRKIVGFDGFAQTFGDEMGALASVSGRMMANSSPP